MMPKALSVTQQALAWCLKLHSPLAGISTVGQNAVASGLVQAVNIQGAILKWTEPWYPTNISKN